MHSLLKRFLFIAGLLTTTLFLGSFGFMYVEGWPFFDSFYMSLMTLTTVGYGEVHPLSFQGRLFASFLMVIGVTTMFVCIGVLGETLLRLEMADYFERKRRDRMLKNISGHYIVCGADPAGTAHDVMSRYVFKHAISPLAFEIIRHFKPQQRLSQYANANKHGSDADNHQKGSKQPPLETEGMNFTVADRSQCHKAHVKTVEERPAFHIHETEG